MGCRVLLDDLVVGVHGPAGTVATLLIAALVRLGAGLRPGLRALVEAGPGLAPRLLEGLGGRGDGRGVLALQRLAHAGDAVLEPRLERPVELVALFLHELLGLVGQAIRLVAG